MSATAMMGKYGFFTADYEYVDYNSIRYRFANEFKDVQNARNQVIRNTYQAASNFRVGIEGRLENFFVRGGFGYYGNPYKNASEKASRTDLSLGIGLRSDRRFLDVAFIHSQTEQSEIAYSVPYVQAPVATLSGRMNTIAVTLGVKF